MNCDSFLFNNYNEQRMLELALNLQGGPFVFWGQEPNNRPPVIGVGWGEGAGGGARDPASRYRRRPKGKSKNVSRGNVNLWTDSEVLFVGTSAKAIISKQQGFQIHETCWICIRTIHITIFHNCRVDDRICWNCFVDRAC